MNGLDHFEALAEQLVEGTFERLFRPRLHPSEVARQLARAMENGRVTGDSGQVLLPNRYWVFLNPDDFAALEASGDTLLLELSRYLERLAAEGAAPFNRGPIAAAVATTVARRGGLLSAQDLAAYRIRWRAPLRGRYRSRTILTMPPPGSGGVILTALNVSTSGGSGVNSRKCSGSPGRSFALTRKGGCNPL